MRRACFAVLLAGGLCGLCGCGFLDWASTEDPATRTTPAQEFVSEVGNSGLNGLEQGGIWAGAAALLFTSAKTGLRLWGKYQASKKTIEAALPAPEVKP